MQMKRRTLIGGLAASAGLIAAPRLIGRAVAADPFKAAWIYVGPVESLQKAQELCAKIKERDSGQKCRPVVN